MGIQIAAVRTILLLAATLVPAGAQWLRYPSPGTPRTKDGQPNLSAPAPKTPQGNPDLSGIWLVDDAKYFFDLAADLPPDAVHFQPWAKALSEQRERNLHKDDPLALCMPPGVPRVNTNINFPFKIIQTPLVVVMLYETSSIPVFRQVFMDGRPLPPDPQPTWSGYSVGTWESGVLKVDTAGFNDRGWIDTSKGHPQTDALHVTERFRRLDFGHLEIAITIDDPKAYTQPWTAKVRLHLLPDTELLETVCENPKDVEHMVGK
jgi:hypothetical protein